MTHPSASFSATLRARLDDRPGAFADLARAIGDAGGLLGAIDLVRVEGDTKIRDVTVLAADADHIDRIVAAARDVPGVEVDHVSDRTFLMHLGGKIEVVGKTPLKTRDDLSMAYTPGVARVSMAIAQDPQLVWNLTIKKNTVAVVTDGTAVLGLGDIGPEAALPVMEGKALLFKEFGGVDAWPICLATKDEDEIVAAVRAIAPVFGGINLEDISAPRCFSIEERLREELDIPVFHDDQHGTARRRPRLVSERAASRRQTARRRQGRHHGCRCCGRRHDEDSAGGGRRERHRCRSSWRAVARRFVSVGDEGELCGAHEPESRTRTWRRRSPRRGRLYRALRSRRSLRRGHLTHGRRCDRVRHGESDSRGCPGGDRRPRRRHRDRSLRLPESDQQRACVSGHLSGRPRCAGFRHHRADEDRSGRGDRGRDSAGRAEPRLHRPQRLQHRGCATCRSGGRRGSESRSGRKLYCRVFR